MIARIVYIAAKYISVSAKRQEHAINQSLSLRQGRFTGSADGDACNAVHDAGGSKRSWCSSRAGGLLCDIFVLEYKL